jgi:hypothetical protein
MKNEIIKSYKGFNKDLTCRGFQYEVGKEYECDNAIICEEGFHACENPIDCFYYYDPAESVFHEVEQRGKLAKHDDDSKVASTKIKIGLKIDIKTIVECGIKFIFSKVTWSDKSQATGYKSGSQATGDNSGSQATGDNSGSQATGNYSGSQATGYKSGSQATGDYSMSSVNGYKSKTSIIDTDKIKSKNSVAMGIGICCEAKASLGNWIILAESEKDKKGDWNIIFIKSAQVDGKKIKADTFYTLKNGKFVEVK